MTREQVKKLLPIMQAYAEGKTIQFLNGGKWYDVYDTDFYQSPDVYRIKPEPKYRPFKTKEECWNEMLKHQPFGWIVYKRKYYNIRDVTYKKITILYECDVCCLDFKSCTEEVTFTDGAPFGIKEE